MGVLGTLGLTPFEEEVLELLVQRGSGTSAELAEESGHPRREVDGALQVLERRGLAVTLVGEPGRFAAAPPVPALEALVSEHQQALEQVRAYGQELERRTREGPGGRRPEELLAVVVGEEAVRAQFGQLQREAQDEVLIFDRPPYLHTDAGRGVNDVGAQRIADGVVYRTVYDRCLLEDPDTLARVRRELAGGEQGRVLAGVPLKLALADRRLALLPLLDAEAGRPQAAVLVRPSVLLDSLAALFEALWARAVPLREGPSEQADPELKQVVALLATGLTDAGIARHLGTSERTVRRRIAAALEALGAETRFQAGLQAQQQGWLPPLD